MQVNDTRQPLAERLATFDGFKRHVTNTSVVNQNLHAQVEMLNTEIARRINVLQIDSGTKVWSLQCHFKPCADGHVRFIWASRISLEQIDGTGYAVEREEDDPLASASITSSITSIIMQKDAPYHAPVAKKWSGEPTPCDGSIFHIPLPGMTSFREPSWWGAEKLVGITNLLPSATAPAPRPALPKVWQMANVQRTIYPAAPPTPNAPPPNEGPAAGQTRGRYTARSPRLPPVSGASSSRSVDASPRAPAVAGGAALQPNRAALPRSMARAVRMYQVTQQPSGLYTPRSMFHSPRAGRHLKEGASTPREDAPAEAAPAPTEEVPAAEAAEAAEEAAAPPAEEAAAEEAAAEEAAAEEAAAEEAAGGGASEEAVGEPEAAAMEAATEEEPTAEVAAEEEASAEPEPDAPAAELEPEGEAEPAEEREAGE